MEKREANKIIQSFAIAGIIGAAMVLIHLIMVLSGTPATWFGVLPREPMGALGILSSPWIHANWGHLLSNLAPLVIFIAASLYFYRKAFLRSIPWMYLMTGFWVWLAGHEGSHIGASGIVYGLAAFLFFSGIFRRDTRSIALSLIIAFFYGSMVWGVLPVQPGVSWESHLFGALAGTAFAWHFRKVGVKPRKKYIWEEEPEETPEDANAVWNYRENWSGANQMYYPSDHNYPE